MEALLLNWKVQLIISLILHFISDFLLQNREMATKKSSEFRYLFRHCTIIHAVFFTVLLLLYNIKFALLFSTLYAIIHGFQDWHIWRLYKAIREKKIVADFKYWEDPLFYDFIGLDQILHIITIILLWGLL